MAAEAKNPAGLPSISVIIPALNPGPELAECLEPLRRSSYPRFEVLVVDDGSAVPVDPGEPFRALRLAENRGPAGARNAGAEAASGEILLFIDTDVVIKDDCLQIVGEFYREGSRRDRGLTGVQSEEMKYSNFSSVYKNLWLRYSFLWAPRESGLFYTSIAAVPRQLFLRLGGFDGGYRTPSLEDTDFGNRILKDGGKVVIEGRLEVQHHKYYSLRGLLKNDFLRSADETRTWLRNRSGDPALFAGKTSVPLGFIAGLGFAALGVLGVLGGLVFHSGTWLWLIPIALAGIWLGNLVMIQYMGKIRGIGFLLRLLLFLPLDLVVAGAGILRGIGGYLTGRRY
jgi:glycosyltransferase involved in cell wall biosynthesis